MTFISEMNKLHKEFFIQNILLFEFLKKILGVLKITQCIEYNVGNYITV